MNIKHLTITLLSLYLTAMWGMKSATAASFTVVADGLNNPGGLSFGQDGKLYITEGGSGGEGPCVPPPSGSGDSLCLGNNGVVSVIDNGEVKPILTGLPSLARTDGTRAAGPRDIQFDPTGQAYILLGYGANPTFRDRLGETGLGTIITPDLDNNTWTSIADISNHELVNNPDGEDLNSNPLKFIIDGNQMITIDSAANSLVSYDIEQNTIQTLAVFPQQQIINPVFPPGASPSPEPEQISTETAQTTTQSVPTAITQGPDNAYYISEYTGFPFPEGGAKIYRVGDDGTPTIYADGLTQLIDLDFDPEGNLYALQYANESAWKGNPAGSLIKIAPDGTQTTVLSGNGLESPTGLSISDDGVIYIANRGDRPWAGQIIRVTNTQSVPEPHTPYTPLIFSTLGLICFTKKHKFLLNKH
jgi:sugar lactone lactonase YvrE